MGKGIDSSPQPSPPFDKLRIHGEGEAIMSNSNNFKILNAQIWIETSNPNDPDPPFGGQGAFKTPSDPYSYQPAPAFRQAIYKTPFAIPVHFVRSIPNGFLPVNREACF